MRCPYCNRRIINDISTQNRINRRNQIQLNIEDDMTIERLYRIMRIKGYRYTRKTFARDLDFLKNSGQINLFKEIQKTGGYQYRIKRLQ